MKLGVVTNYYPDYRPLSEYGFHLVNGLRQSGHGQEVAVIASSPGPSDVPRYWRYGGRFLSRELERAVARERVDAVLVNCLFTSWGDDHASNLAGFFAIRALSRLIPTIALVHHLPQTLDVNRTGYRVGLVERMGIDIACRLLAKAQWVAFTVERDRGFFSSRYDHPQTIKVEHGLLGPARWFDWPEGADPAVLSLGKWGRSKDPEPLLRMAQSSPSLRLNVAGPSHPRAPGFIERLRTRYQSDRIHLLGYVSEPQLERLFQQSQLVVVPYNADTGVSGVLHLAAQHGRVMLTRDLPLLRAEAERLGLITHFYQDDEDLACQTHDLLARPLYLREAGRHNADQARRLEMPSITGVYWGLLGQRQWQIAA